MKSLKEISVEIDNGFKQLREEIDNDLARISAEIDATTEVLQKAIADGDLSENASFTEAKDKISKLTGNHAKYMNLKYACMSAMETGEYSPTGYVLPGSTIRVRCTTTGDVYVWKILSNFSYVSKGIISTESDCYKQLSGKSAGAVYHIKHKHTGELYEFKLEEVY